MIKASVIGGAGYTGGELIRILLNHDHVALVQVVSQSQAGKALMEVHQDLIGDTDILFNRDLSEKADVIFLCLGHGRSEQYLNDHPIPTGTKVIDLSQDYRLAKTYGLPELNKAEITEADFVANPGCFATAIQLALLPLAYNGMLKEVHVSGVTGSTGAGMNPTSTTHFSWRNNNLSTYKAFEHQHLAEVKKSLLQYQNWFDQPINFIPYRGNFTRGIMVTAYQYCEWPLEEAIQVFKEYYEEHPFVQVTEQPLDVKMVVNTNKCLINLSMHNGYLMVQSVIDNLVKGASGQAVQNMNLMFGLEETRGLKLKGTRF
jgi:N-acetyl-gamma-glutamyl-phosphate reductase